jgi:hypothetical protein
MSGAFVFSDHPIEDLIRKNLNMAGVFVRAARNQGWNVGAGVAVANAREAFDKALQLVRALGDAEQERWYAELLSVQAAIHNLEEASENSTSAT